MNRIQIKSRTHITNPTRLKTIPRKYIKFDLEETWDGSKCFNMKDFDSLKKYLASLRLPREASAYIYVHAGNAEEKFSLGKLSDMRIPKYRLLDSLPAGETKHFRLLVVDDETSKILASAEDVRPKSLHEEEREPLLPVEIKELGNIIWKVNLVEEQQPILHLNQEFPDIINKMKNDKIFQALILPNAVRSCLKHFVTSTQDTSLTWIQNWGSFLKELGMHKSIPLSDDEDPDIDRWLDKVIEKFCKNKDVFARAVEETNRISEKLGLV